MEQSQRTRLAMLGVAGLLLAVGGYFYWQYSNQKAQEAELDSQVPVAHVRSAVHQKTGAVATAGTVGIKQELPGGPAAKLATATATDSKAPAGNVKLAANAGVAAGQKPPIAAIRPTAATASGAGAPVTNPPVTNPHSGVAGAFQTAAGVPGSSLPNGPQLNTGARPGLTQKAPLAAAAQKPVPAPVLTQKPAQAPVQIAQKPSTAVIPGAQRLTTAAPVAQAAPVAAQPQPAATNGKGYQVTSLAQAAAEAKSAEGRNDPMQPLASFLPYPRHLSKAGTGAGSMAVPPPPPDAKAAESVLAKAPGAKGAAARNIDKLIPPPPPSAADANSSIGDLPIDQLPVPPSRPTIGDKLKVLAVLDNKAIVSFPMDMRVKNKWPRTVTLGSGQQFESITVVGVSKDGVTIEEDGERTLKPLATIR